LWGLASRGNKNQLSNVTKEGCDGRFEICRWIETAQNQGAKARQDSEEKRKQHSTISCGNLPSKTKLLTHYV
jgi:hypothetical protein